MAAMAMVWEPLMKNEVQSFPGKTETLNRFSNVHYSMKNGPRSLNLGSKSAGTCRLFFFSNFIWLFQLQIGTIAVFLHMPNCHRFITCIE
jgi:hypothetical protein